MKFYTYVYLDPRKSGIFTYGDFITFFYEPYYIGKGCKERLYKDLKYIKSSKINCYKYNKIQKIRKENYDPKDFIIKIINDIEEKCSFCFEKCLIQLIGRYDIKEGCLTNLTDGGEGGNIKYRESKEVLYNKGKGWRNKKQPKELILRRTKHTKGNKYWLNKKHKEENKKKISLISKNKPKNYKLRWISNMEYMENKLIKLEDLNKFLSIGWIKGRKFTKRDEYGKFGDFI